MDEAASNAPPRIALPEPTSSPAPTPSPVPTPVRRSPVEVATATPETLEAEPTVGAGAVVTTADASVPVVDASLRMGPLNVRLNFWIYHRGTSADGSSAGDLYRTHAWTEESERLTDHGRVTTSIELSPNGRWLAYMVDSNPRTLHVLDVESGLSTELAEVAGHGFMSWSPDSQEVLVNDSPGVEPSGSIQAISIADGTRRTLVESDRHFPSLGVMADTNDLVFWEIGPEPTRLVRMRIDTGERVAELAMPDFGYRAYDRENRVLYLTQQHHEVGRVVALDLSQDGLEELEIPTPTSDETDVAISPDGTRVAYASGLYQQARELYFVDLTDPSAVLHMNLDLGGRGYIRGVEWAPASTAVVFGYGSPDSEQLFVAAQNGTIRPVGDIGGVPYAIVPDGT